MTLVWKVEFITHLCGPGHLRWRRRFSLKRNMIMFRGTAFVEVFLGKGDSLVIGEGGTMNRAHVLSLLSTSCVTWASVFSSVRWGSGYQGRARCPVGCPVRCMSSGSGSYGWVSHPDGNNIRNWIHNHCYMLLLQLENLIAILSWPNTVAADVITPDAV